MSTRCMQCTGSVSRAWYTIKCNTDREAVTRTFFNHNHYDCLKRHKQLPKYRVTCGCCQRRLHRVKHLSSRWYKRRLRWCRRLWDSPELQHWKVSQAQGLKRSMFSRPQFVWCLCLMRSVILLQPYLNPDTQTKYKYLNKKCTFDTWVILQHIKLLCHRFALEEFYRIDKFVNFGLTLTILGVRAWGIRNVFLERTKGDHQKAVFRNGRASMPKLTDWTLTRKCTYL